MQKFSILKDIHLDLERSWEVQSIFSDEKKELNFEDWSKKEVYKLLNNHEDIQDIVEQNKRAILINLLWDKLPKANKGKEKPLKRFIKDYLNWLSIKEDNNLLLKIDYYLDLYSLYWFSKENKLDNEVLLDRDNFSKAEILFELLYNSSLLPDYENQKQFNEEMLKFISRLEKSIEKFVSQENAVVVREINSRNILFYLQEQKTFRVSWSKTIDKWLIKQIWYDFYLWERVNLDEENEYSFSFLVNDDSLVSRSTFIAFLQNNQYIKEVESQKEFLYESDNFFNYYIYIWEERYTKEQWSWEWIYGFNYEGFEVKLYAIPKRNFTMEEEFFNVCLKLPKVFERLINDVYFTYGIENWQKIWLPDKLIIFNVEDYLNVRYDWSGNENLDGNNDDYWTKLSRGNDWKENYKFYESKDISYTLDDLVLEKKLYNEIEELLDFYKDIKFYIENNWVLPKWILLHWPSWTWKTTIVLILGKESWAGIFVAEPNQENSLVWESANNIQNIINKAKKFIDETWKPAIIYFDEADTIYSKRWWDVKDFKEWMISVILQGMDWFDKKYEGMLTFVFASNRKDMLDPALLSRIDKHLEIPLPSKEAREKILDLHIRKKMNWLKETISIYETADLDLSFIAEKLEWKSGRFIKNLVKNFHNKALREYKKDKNFVITNEFILEAVKFTEDKEESINKIVWFKF